MSAEATGCNFLMSCTRPACGASLIINEVGYVCLLLETVDFMKEAALPGKDDFFTLKKIIKLFLYIMLFVIVSLVEIPYINIMHLYMYFPTLFILFFFFWKCRNKLINLLMKAFKYKTWEFQFFERLF